MLECLDDSYIHLARASLSSDVCQSFLHVARYAATSCSLSPLRSYTHGSPLQIVMLSIISTAYILIDYSLSFPLDFG